MSTKRTRGKNKVHSKAKTATPKKAKAMKAATRAKKAASTPKAKIAKSKRGKASKAANVATTGRQTQRFALVDGIPETLRATSAGRQICDAIKARKTATKKDLAADLGPSFPDPTLRHNLWKLHTAGVLSIVSE